ncbi:LysR family transcriptional regulator [Microbacterium sp. GXF7504]
MELRQLRYFVAVVGAGSLTAAATALHLAQPSLSVAVRRLEEELGVPLLTRTARGVEPTAAGRRLFDGATRILADVDELGDKLRRHGAGVTGTLTLAAVPALMWHRIPALLRLQADQAPDVDVRLLDPPPWQAIEMLRQRSVDAVAVMVADPRRFAAQHRDEFELVDWGAIPLVAALPPEEDDAPDPLPLAAFDGRRMVLPRRTAAVPSLPEAVDEALLRHGVVPAEIRTEHTIQASVPLIEAGLACGILPDPDGASLARFRLTVRELQPAPRPLRAFVLTRPGAARDATLAGLLRRVLSTRPPDRVRSSIR